MWDNDVSRFSSLHSFVVHIRFRTMTEMLSLQSEKKHSLDSRGKHKMIATIMATDIVGLDIIVPIVPISKVPFSVQ